MWELIISGGFLLVASVFAGLFDQKYGVLVTRKRHRHPLGKIEESDEST